MGLISDIQEQKKNPKRVNIFVDGQFAFAISKEAKIINKLKTGDLVSETEVEKLILDDQVERLLEKAGKFLSFRPRSEKEIFDNLRQKLKLTDKGEEEKKLIEKSLEKTLEKLKKWGQINDLEFAKWWKNQRINFKKSSINIIKKELIQKGIKREIIEEVLEEEKIDEFSLALELAQKKARRFENLPEKDFSRKIYQLLASKGFNWEVAKRVVDTLLQKR